MTPVPLHALRVTVNGTIVAETVDPSQTLLEFLRGNLGLAGTKNGCGTGHCGTCTVLVNGRPKRSCLIRLKQLTDITVITTIEGLGGSIQRLHPVQRAFAEAGAVQCGFCTPGMILSTVALLHDHPDPDEATIRRTLAPNLCRCTGYQSIVRAVQLAAAYVRGVDEPAGPRVDGEPATVVGRTVPRKDAPDKVLGNPIFADDLARAEAVHGVLLLSEYTHARIESVDCSAARSCPGVVAVLTRADLPGSNVFGLYAPDQHVYADGEVFFRGEVIAAVIADTVAHAEEAGAQIRVGYHALPILDDPELNLADGAAVVRPDLQSNVAHHVAVRKGDVDAAFAQADLVIEGEYSTPFVEHAYLEPESCLAEPGTDGSVTVWTGSQGSYAYRAMIAACLAIPEEKVRVVMTACGGGFGGKEEPTVQIHAALAAIKTGRPVKMTLTREQSLRMSVKRHAARIRMQHAADKTGRIVAVRSRVVADAGAYLSLTKPVVFRSAVTAPGPYDVPNVHADSYGVFTHRTPNGAFRGFGSTQVCFAAEIQMDKVARALGIDAGELRRRNGFVSGSQTATGQVLSDGVGYRPTLEAAIDGLTALRAEFEPMSRPAHKRLGFGLASSYKNVGIGAGTPDSASAGVALTAAGRIEVTIGAADMGQGSDTVAAQIAAEALGIPYDLIDVVAGDTDRCPDGGMTTASRQTFVTGNAVLQACAGFKPLLARALGAIEAGDRLPEWRVMLRRLADAVGAGGSGSGEGSDVGGVQYRATYVPPATISHREDATEPSQLDRPDDGIHYAYCFVSSAVAVEVDVETGRIEVLKVYSAQDVGKAIHPQNVIGQIEGSVAMGVGYALSEEFVEHDSTLITNTLGKLKIPRFNTTPSIVAVVIEEPQSSGPFGAKGMGEVGLNPLAPAISNAVFDAVGIRLQRLPMKPETVLAELAAEREVSR